MNRNEECGIKTLDGDEMPLYKFITEEVDEKLQAYHPGAFKIVIGHSFSASFSLYAYLKKPSYFSAVVAHSPLDHFQELISAFNSKEEIDLGNIYLSVGGGAQHEDFYHRNAFDNLKKKFPNFFTSISYFIADNSDHNAVPIIANPYLLTKLFSTYKERFSEIVVVDEEYKIVELPRSIEVEMTKIQNASKLGTTFYPPEIADLNGLASRYENSNLSDYAQAVYELGIRYFPNYYDFYLQLY